MKRILDYISLDFIMLSIMISLYFLLRKISIKYYKSLNKNEKTEIK